MTNITTTPDSSQRKAETAIHLFDDWFDPIEAGLRNRVREFIHGMIEGELDIALSRPRYARHAKSPSGETQEAVGATGHRHGHRSRSLLGSFGRVEIEVPRARLNTPDGKTTEWKSKALKAYQRRTLIADALIAGSYPHPRRHRDARASRPQGHLHLAARRHRRARGRPEVLLAIKSMGGESAEAWRSVLDDLVKRGLRRPEFLIVDGASGLDKAIAAIWDGVPVQRCTVHKHRNLLAHAPERLHEEIGADYTDII
jgi:transposase-like protein